MLPLPPGPTGLSRWYHLTRFALGVEKEHLMQELLARYGPVTRIAPYTLMWGAEAHKLLTSAQPSELSTWPNEDFPTLASMDGERHRFHRRWVMEAFTTQRLVEFTGPAAELARRRISTWSGTIDLFSQMHDFALEVLTANMLGLSMDSEEAREFVRHYWPLIFRADGVVKPPLHGRRVAAARQGMWKLLGELIPRRRQSPGPDALSALVAAYDRRDFEATEEDLIRYAYMLMDFGHGDIAIFATYALAVLAQREDLWRRLREENARYTEDAPAYLESRLPFTLAFLREVERLYPPVGEMHRAVSQELSFQGFRIPKGEYVVAAIEPAHLSSQYFAEPARFDPDRFLTPRSEHLATPMALFGFGAGRHMCVAMVYSRMATAVLLHEVLKARRLTLLDRELPDVDRRTTLQKPQRPIHLSVQEA